MGKLDLCPKCGYRWLTFWYDNWIGQLGVECLRCRYVRTANDDDWAKWQEAIKSFPKPPPADEDEPMR